MEEFTGPLRCALSWYEIIEYLIAFNYSSFHMNNQGKTACTIY